MKRVLWTGLAALAFILGSQASMFGQEAYYIDYEHGNDNNSGTKDEPFQHHPWDTAATGQAATHKGAHVYYFKRGVIYRGSLVAKDSGEDGNPILLTVDKTWGEGEAAIYGSERIVGGWKKCTDEDSEIPSAARRNVWFVDLDKSYEPHMVYEVSKDKVVKLNVARTPNWQVSNPDDPRSEWWEMTGADEKSNPPRLEDTVHLTQNDTDAWKGAYVWMETWAGGNSKPFPIGKYDPDKHALHGDFLKGDKGEIKQFFRYYIEDHPSLLTSPNEFYYDKDGQHPGRLYLWLEDDRDPNKSVIELARQMFFLVIEDKSNIVIDGLDIRFFNRIDYKTSLQVGRPRFHCAAILLKGAVENIKIQNCVFAYLPHGIVSMAYDGKGADHLEISNNKMKEIEAHAIHLSASGAYADPKANYELEEIGEQKARLNHVLVKGNEIRDSGFRNANLYQDEGTGIAIRDVELAEICDNVIDHVAYQGIDVHSVPAYNSTRVYPLIRILIHNNTVTNSMLDSQDYGGIESWRCGPCYIYNNISGNAVGYLNQRYKTIDQVKEAQYKKDYHWRSSFAPCIYLDHQYKSYTFNNIMWGKNNNANDPIYNSVGFQEATGFANIAFNNTIYNVAVGLAKGQPQDNRQLCLNNLFINLSLLAYRQGIEKENTIEYDSLAYGYNVCEGSPKNYGLLGSDNHKPMASPEAWKEFLNGKGALLAGLDTMTNEPQVVDAANHDFKLRKGVVSIGNARKVFVPWGLYKVVGEWGFYKHRADPKIILGENLNCDEKWRDTDTYQEIPRNNLVGHHIDEENFKMGPLENWIEGALEFNGNDQYCELVNCPDLDAGSGNLLIEAMINAKKGPVASKMDNGTGYSLTIQDDGKVRLLLLSSGVESFRESDKAVNDGQWHHIVAQVDRDKPDGMDIFIDGKLSNGTSAGTLKGNLTNSGSFLVGKEGDSFFSGLIDFLRVSHGTLKDAETTIHELYQWEFDGPFLKDFYGNPPMKGKARDVGAIGFTD